MSAVATERELATIKEANELTGVPVATLRAWIREGRIWSGKRGDGKRVVRLSEVRERKARQSQLVEE